jgi:N-acetylmuramoyl-L-alanine amidase
MFSIKEHVLNHNGKPVDFVDTPNKGGSLKHRFLIIHYTAGISASSAINHLKKPLAKASAHLVIGVDGSITQMVPFNRIAWHAGKSQWQELIGLNSYSLGIELVNAGKLRRREDGKWVTWSENIIPDKEVVVLTHKNESNPAGWQIYPKLQLDRAIEVSIALKDRYKFDDILGHDDVAPTRKVDPGPAFPMTSFESLVMGRE